MSKQILPDIDLLNSREFYGAYNSKDLYKGKSFNMAGEWSPEVHYFNDDFVVDFVSYQGALLSCKRSHQSSSQNAPELQYNIVNGFRVPWGVAQNSYWTFVLGAIPGEKGDTGSIYTPIYNERTGELEWQLEESTTPIAPMRIKGAGIDDIYTRTDGTKQLVHIVYDGGKETEIVEIPHGKDGKDGRDGSELIDVDRVEGENGDTYIFKFKEHNGVIRNYSVFVKRGPKGDAGKNATIEVVEVKNLPHGSKPTVKNIGSDTNAKLSFGLPEAPATPAFKLEYGKDGYDQLSVNLLWSSDDSKSWNNLGSVGGKSPKLMRVRSTVDNPDMPDETRRNDRIVWGYDGVDVSSWSVLCMLDDLRGDTNIHIGTTPPMMKDSNGGDTLVEDHDKIWYDPSDNAVDAFSATDFLYASYLEMGGNLKKAEFVHAMANIFSVQVVTTKVDTPTENMMNTVWIIPSKNEISEDIYEEWIVVEDPENPGNYIWERWGSGTMTVDLEDYYTKDQVNQYVSDTVETAIKEVVSDFDGGSDDDISEWE